MVSITFRMYNLNDNTNPGSEKMLDGFYTMARPMGWPGRQVAELYLVAAWSLYLMHEAQELVTKRGSSFEYRKSLRKEGGLESVFRKGEIPVIDPHNIDGPNQQALANTNDIPGTINRGFGAAPGYGEKIVANGRVRALQDIENQITFLAGTYGRWE
jgi:hypothetical protein